MLRRFSVFSLAFLLCLSLFPARAFAWDFLADGCFWRGNTSQGMYGVCVHADNQFDAAAWVIYGRDPSMLTSEVRTKLSDPNYGGRFYEYVQTFSHMDDLTQYPDWLPAYVGVANIFINGLAGDVNFYTSNVSESLYSGAKIDFGRVLAGEDLGGTSGGGPVDSSGFSGVVVNAFASTSSNSIRSFEAPNASFADGVITPTGGVSYFSAFTGSNYYVSTLQLYVATPAVLYANDLISQGYDVIFALSLGSTHDTVIVYGNDLHISWNAPSNCYAYYGSNIHYVVASSCGRVYHSSDGFFHVTYDVPSGAVSGTLPSGSTSSYFSSVISSPIPVPIIPPGGDWPEPSTPAAPVAPELPEPAEPVVETPVTPTVPAPVWPDITINIEPDPVPGTTPSGLDYTELLTRMNDNLISIDSFARAINSNLNSLRSDLLAEFNGVIDSLRNIYNYLLTIDSVLETHCTHLRNKIEQSAVFIANYMRTLIKWLADQLDFDDLTNVEAPDNSLLTTINEKLGGGTYEPNPIKDESGYYEWLDDLWDRFLLGDNWQSSMGSISGSFSELKTRFPFSVPWDIVALFRLFVHDPVTPSFDLPLYFSPDGSTPVHVDLSPWDSVASLVRPMIFVIFALKLALLSRDLLGGLGADKGGL